MADYKPMPLFEEVVGALVAEETINEEVASKPDAGFTSEYSGENFENFLEMGEFFGWFAPKEKEAVETIKNRKACLICYFRNIKWWLQAAITN